MNYNHLTTFERGCIEALHKVGYSTRNIASEIGRHHSSVARELNRSDEVVYNAQNAQKSHEERRKHSKGIGKFTDELSQIIDEKLSLTWSPEQIANTTTLAKSASRQSTIGCMNGNYIVQCMFYDKKGNANTLLKNAVNSLWAHLSLSVQKRLKTEKSLVIGN